MNETDANSVIRGIREHYIERLITEFDRLRGVEGERVFTEAALRHSDGQVATEGDSQLGTRVDVVVASTGRRCAVDSTAIPSFSPFRLHRGGTDFVICPFQWDWCIVTMNCAPESFAWQPIRDWFDRWFDAGDSNPSDEHGLFGVIHFLAEPRHSDGSVAIITDLGSAPLEAFYGLLDACSESHPTSAQVANVHSTGNS